MPQVTCVFSVTRAEDWVCGPWQDLGPEKQSKGRNRQTEARGRPESTGRPAHVRYVGGWL